MKQFGSLLLALGLAMAPAASLADCADNEGEQGCAEPAAEQTEEEAAGYTWEELVEKIPSLKQYELGFQRSTEKGAGEDEGTYMLCRKVRGSGSRIRRRACMPLDEALALATKQRTEAEERRLEFLTNRSLSPVVTLPRVRQSF
ncbi:MAG: hypothetical protein AAF184_22730 [Pseudomonadota bacterium]